MSNNLEFYGAPRLPRELVPRPHLLGGLSPLPPLSVVRAPAGSGKTVLLADWSSSRTEATSPGVWFTADASTTTRLALWVAVVRLLGDAGLLEPDIVEEQLVPSLRSAEALSRELVRIFSSLADGIDLVLDSFEHVSDPLAYDDLLWVIRSCPAVNVVVATRTRGSLETLDAALDLDPAVMLLPELVMTEGDIAQALGRAGVEGAAEAAPVVRSATGGLPIAVRIAILALRKDPEFVASPRFRADLTARLGTLLGELVRADDRTPRLFEFAVSVAVADVLTPALAADLSGYDDAAELLDVAEQQGLGLWIFGPHGRCFAFTPVFRAFFLADLLHRNASERDRLWRIAAAWAAQNERGYNAVRLAIEIEDFALASDHLRDSWLDSRKPSDTEGLMRLLGPIPRRKLRKYPLLLMVLALSYNASGVHRIKAVETFGLAMIASRLHGGSTDPVTRTVLFAIEITGLRLSGLMERSLASSEKGIAYLQGFAPDERDDLGGVFAMTMTQIGLSFYYSGRTAAADDAFLAAYSHATGRHLHAEGHVLSLLAGTSALAGEIAAGATHVAAVDDLGWSHAWRDDYFGAGYHLAQAVFALERFDFVAAQSAIDVMKPHLQTLEHWPLFAHLQALVDLGEGRALSGAAEIAAQLADTGRPSITKHTRAQLEATRALLLIAAGQADEVERILKSYSRDIPAVAIVLARCELLADRPEQAIRLVSHLDNAAVVTARHAEEALVLGAAAALRLGLTDEAVARIARLPQGSALEFHLALVPAADLEALRAAVQTSAQSWTVSRDIPTLLPPALHRVGLTERERIVLRGLAATNSLADLAAMLFVSNNTVKSQLRSIYRKLGVSSRDEALKVASGTGLLSE